jgi:hypothetical protein
LNQRSVRPPSLDRYIDGFAKAEQAAAEQSFLIVVVGDFEQGPAGRVGHTGLECEAKLSPQQQQAAMGALPMTLSPRSPSDIPERFMICFGCAGCHRSVQCISDPH